MSIPRTSFNAVRLTKQRQNLTQYFCLLILLIGCNSENGLDVTKVPNPKLIDNGYVSNPHGIISAAAVNNINQKLALIDKEGMAQIAVVVVNSIGDHVPKDFAVDLFNHWGIGSDNTDNGLLILMVKDKRRIEFETGYGLEAVLPDAICFRIQQDRMLPHFQRGDYDKGMLEGVEAVLKHLGNVSSQDHWSEQRPDSATSVSQFSKIFPTGDNEITLITSELLTIAGAWSLIRSNEPQLGLPEIVDTSFARMERPAHGRYSYTFQIPFELTLANAIEATFNSFGSIFINVIFVLLVGIASWDIKRYKYLNIKRKYFELFSNDIAVNNRFMASFLLVSPVAFILAYCITTREFDAPPYVGLMSIYAAWSLYAHLHFLLIIPLKESRMPGVMRHQKYNRLSEAYRHIKVLSLIFPLPFLLLFRFWHQRRMWRLRDLPYACDCGATMTKLDEAADNNFLSLADIREEELKSVDFDVWHCSNCNKQKRFEYENHKSGAMRCHSCARKTIKLEKEEIVVNSTESSEGFGYNHYTCLNCSQNTQIKFTIPKKSRSGSESSRNSSSSSSSSSWGGGSSGGGGAGSSW